MWLKVLGTEKEASVADGTTENVDVNESGQPMVLIETATPSTASETP